jgi:hypothetical protein
VGSPLIKSGAEIGSQPPPFFCLHGIIVLTVMLSSSLPKFPSIRGIMGPDHCPTDTVRDKTSAAKSQIHHQKMKTGTCK